MKIWDAEPKKLKPLAERMRPENMDEVIGQKHIISKGKMLRRLIDADMITSMLFVGPPGTGKTSLAEVIAKCTKSNFVRLSAVLAGVADIRRVVEEAQNNSEMYGDKTILFVDEIHRFNKSQQDALLPWVEAGTIVLIGATTENPSFEVNKALLSRLRVFRLERLKKEELAVVVGRAVAFLKNESDIKIAVSKEAMEYWCNIADGDARAILVALELAFKSAKIVKKKVSISLEDASESMQERIVSYDKGDDEHYDTISAFIKSMRGSDVDGSLYWLAKMVIAGEDPKFIARRMIILASEDVGNADPKALWLAMSAFDAVKVIGFPEAEIILSQVVAYLASAPKSNASYMAIANAKAAVESGKSLQVPLHLQDGHYSGSRAKDYLYPHNFPEGFVRQSYLPEGVEGGFYEATDHGYEALIKKRMEELGNL